MYFRMWRKYDAWLLLGDEADGQPSWQRYWAENRSFHSLQELASIDKRVQHIPSIEIYLCRLF